MRFSDTHQASFRSGTATFELPLECVALQSVSWLWNALDQSPADLIVYNPLETEHWGQGMKQPSLREEIAALRAEIEHLRDSKSTADAGASKPDGDEQSRDQPDDVPKLLGELGELVQTMLDEAEESFTEHPLASVSAALALGIVIGRLTAK
ncbi:hypothetical protein [uncultured Hoeflea sp.]|uniref:hypothetical protein n=1 Tax=uncultured Hoeflea sp. TaxID=538666 RepID=UPI0030DCF8F2|tara:strand:- start:50 stop:505 length:456 start_codon:yes stop_codon:yes gene_type:complete